MEFYKNNAWRVLAGIIALESLVVMVGWIFGIGALTGIFKDDINMKFPTALGFFLSAIALPFIAKEVRGKKEMAQVVLPAIALLILLIMATLLAGGVLSIQTGIENLFVQDTGSVTTATPGTPAIPTMIAFILFAITSIFLLFDFKKLKIILFSIGIPIVLIGFAAIVGYFLRIPFLYYDFGPTVNPMAPNTAVLFLFLGFALLSIGTLER